MLRFATAICTPLILVLFTACGGDGDGDGNGSSSSTSTSGGIEQAQPFEQPTRDGQVVRNYGGFAFDKSDPELRDAFDSALADYIGSDEHVALIRELHFTEDELPQGKTAREVLTSANGGEWSEEFEPEDDGEDALARIKERGKLVIAYANEEPYGYEDVKTGEVTGEAPEIARVVAEKLGIDEVEEKMVDWNSLIAGLQAGRFDCVAAGMYITPDRAENVLFSNPTYRVGEGFIVKEGNPKALHSFEDVKEHEDAKLGVMNGTFEQKHAEEIGIPEERIVAFKDNNAAVSAVLAGRVDAFAGTKLTVQVLVAKYAE